jgi:hypothetical protein
MCLVNVGNIWEIIIKMLGQRWELFYFNNSQRWPANKIASHHSQLGQRWELTPGQPVEKGTWGEQVYLLGNS